MKKIVSIILVFLVLFMSVFIIESYAVALSNVNVTINKDTVHPGENINVNVSFGENLGSYTVDVAYDSNLLEYVSAEGGTANDNGTRVRVYFYDQTGGTSPRNNMSVIFKAKTNITTSNPTNFSITAEGLANANATIVYDDITTPIIKNFVVEPNYVDYRVALNYSGDVIKNEEKSMKLIVSSEMGRSYEHTRIIAELKSPADGDAKLLATDAQNLEHDIIESGWGSAEGESIGGKNVVKELQVRGLFNSSGNYEINFKLIDRDNSDAVIASKIVNINVKEEANTNTDNNIQKPNNTVTTEKEEPTKLPQTGNTIYFALIPTMLLLCGAYMYLKRKD